MCGRDTSAEYYKSGCHLQACAPPPETAGLPEEIMSLFAPTRKPFAACTRPNLTSATQVEYIL